MRKERKKEYREFYKRNKRIEIERDKKEREEK
jgi:hypothetical protein